MIAGVLEGDPVLHADLACSRAIDADALYDITHEELYI